jgi:hypothetical protein
MSCRVVRRLLALHAGGDLPAAVAARVERHASACAPCGRALAAHRQDIARLARLREPVGPRLGADGADPLGDNFWYAVRRELRTEGISRPDAAGREGIAPPARRGRRQALALRAFAAAAAVLLAALLFLPRTWTSRPASAPGAPGLDRATGPGGEGAVALRTVEPPDGAVAGGPYIERVAVPVAAGGGAAVEESQPLAPPAIQYHIEGWRASDTERESLSF